MFLSCRHPPSDTLDPTSPPTHTHTRPSPRNAHTKHIQLMSTHTSTSDSLVGRLTMCPGDDACKAEWFLLLRKQDVQDLVAFAGYLYNRPPTWDSAHARTRTKTCVGPDCIWKHGSSRPETIALAPAIPSLAILDAQCSRPHCLHLWFSTRMPLCVFS